MTLNYEGYRAIVIGDPDQAFELLDLFPSILLFDDVTFGCTLPDFVASARSIEPHPEMIFMSTDQNVTAMARRLSVRSSIVKPFDPTRLFKLVTECPRFTASGTQISAPSVQFEGLTKHVARMR